jgi:hypothetical protein
MNMKNIINLTPHPINIVGWGEIEPSGQVARCELLRVPAGDVNGIPVYKTSLGKPYGLPEPQDGTIYIVSRQVAEACPERSDLYITDDAVRDDTGKIIGVRGLAQLG